MRASRTLVFCLAILMCAFLPACGGGGNPPPPPAGAPVVTSMVLPQASVNVPYSFYVQATGGTGTYTWSIASGSLPPGLTFNGMTAQISGTPTAGGSYMFTVKVTDGASMSGTGQLTLTVTGAIIITCNSCVSGTNMLPTGTPGVPYTATFTATGGVGASVWCIIETNGNCDDGSGGALPPGLTMGADTGMITGTPTAGTPSMQITVFVHDTELIESRGSTNVTLAIFGVTNASLADGEIFVPYNQSLTVAGGPPHDTYSWSITSGQLPPGLTLGPPSCQNTQVPTCMITGAPTQGGMFPFTVQVTDSQNPPLTATAQLTINVAALSNSALNKNYVFSFSGYKSGHPLIMAGAFFADGTGHITGGRLDVNDGTGEINIPCPNNIDTGPKSQSIQSSSAYSIQSNGLGTLTLVTNSQTYNFHVAIRADGSGSLILDNTDPNPRGSGTIKVQAVGVPIQSIEGNFVLGINGADGGGSRYAAAGRYELNNPNGDLSAGQLDVDDAGTPSQHTFIGTLSVTIDSFGRGCNSRLSYDGQLQNGYVYAYYIVSSNELLVISTDPEGGNNNANLTLWSVLRQFSPGNGFHNSDLAGSSVIGLGARTNGAADVTTGIFVGQGTSGNSCQTFEPATFTFDENLGGTLIQPQSVQGMYCVDNASGRVTLQGFTGWSDSPPVLYLVGGGPGFAAGTDSGVSAGTIASQTGSNFTNASVAGGYWGGTIMPLVSPAIDSVTSLYANGQGNMPAATQFISGPGGGGGPNNLTPLSYSVDSTGRGVVMQNCPQNCSTFGILYVISPTKFVLLPAGNNPTLNVFGGPPAP
jgi:putative Ig domain-containing protein